MTDLADFLLARIAEDEAETRFDMDCDCRMADVPFERHGLRCGVRMLAECEAKRRLVDEHRLEVVDERWGEAVEYCRRCTYDDGLDRDIYPCPTLRLLALPYADHPDYRQEWTP